MPRIIIFDICSLVIDFLLILTLFIRKMTKGKTNIVFLTLANLIFFSCVFDLLRIVLPVQLTPTRFNQILVYAVHFTYYLFRQLTTPVYVLFLISITGRWFEFKTKRHYNLLWSIPVLMVLVSLIINCFTPFIFYITPDLQYNRGQYILIIYVAALIIMLFATYLLIKNKKMIKNIKFWTLFALLPISVVGLIIQFINIHMAVEIFTTSFPLLLISLIILQPEEILDTTTGAFNITACEQSIKQNFIAKRPMKLIFVKILNSKLLSKQLGDELFNKLIQEVINNFYKFNDLLDYEIFHIESGTFLIVTLETNGTAIQMFMNRLQNYLDEKKSVKKYDIHLEYLISIARSPQDFNTFDQILNYSMHFDSLIQKKNIITNYSDEAMNRFFVIQNNLDAIIKTSIMQNHFQMYYQPIYSIEEQKFTSAEALIRMIDDRYGFIPPGIFIPAAENSGAIHQIGDFIINDVCRFIASCNFESLGLKYIEINLSVAQCIELELVSKIQAALIRNGVTSEKINIEITESSNDINPEISDKNINELSRLGFKFSLDDYGSGYSNLKRITSLPLEIIKMDKVFVDERKEKDMEIVIKNTISMMKKLGKKVLIEGVETQEDFEAFKDFGCDYIQGYYFSKPLPEREFLIFMKKKNSKTLLGE